MSADGTWIPVYQSVRDHRKTYALADWLGIEPPHAVGLMVNLWTWAVDNAGDSGSLDGIGPRTLARAAGWNGDPGHFQTGLITAGFVDTDAAIHNWDDYSGKLLERRATDAERKRKWREQQRGDIHATSAGPDADDTRMSGVEHSRAPESRAPERDAPLAPRGGNGRRKRNSRYDERDEDEDDEYVGTVIDGKGY